MKVKIGKYPNRLMCNWHSNYMDKKYGYIWPKRRAWSRADRVIEKIDDWVQTGYNVINKVYFDRKKQKVKVKIDPWDTWGMDSTLGTIALPMLKQLKATKHGAPPVNLDDVPEHLRPTEQEIENYTKHGEIDPLFFERWNWVMDEMIFAFESLSNDWEEQFYSGEVDFKTVPVDDKGDEVESEDADFFRLDKGPNDSFEIDFDGMEAYQKRIDNGFRLFGTYFQALWD